MSEETPEEIDQRVAPHLEYLAERINLLFSYHFFILEYRDDEDLEGKASDNPRTWRIQTIQNACLHTSLIASRDLDDFFTLRIDRSKTAAKPDDLRASDFGLPYPMQFLSEEERKWINKLIVHTTQHGAAKRGYRWDLLELISKAAAQCVAFLAWIQENYSLEHFNTWTAAIGTQSITKSLLRSIHEEIDRHRKADTETTSD